MNVGVIIATALVLFCWIISKWKSRNNNRPRGPYGLPLLGYLPFLKPETYKQFQTLAKTYGNVFCMKLAFKDAIVLNDFKSIKTAFVDQSDAFSGRHNTFLFDIVLHQRDIFSCDGLIVKEQRRFALSVLRDFGVGKSGAEKLVSQEAEQLIMKLRKKSGTAVHLDEIIFFATLNVMWAISAGSRFEYDDQRIIDLAAFIRLNFKFFNTADKLIFFPFLRYLGGGKGLNEYIANNELIFEFLQKVVDEHKANLVPENEPGDFIDAFLIEKVKRIEIGDKFDTEAHDHPFHEKRLLGTLYDFIHAGVETASVTLQWAIIYMVTWPEIQQRVQEELDRVIGKSRYPQYSDRHTLPFTEAVTLEVQRFASVVPLGAVHRTIHSTKLLGFDIPADAYVFPNLYAVHHDVGIWGDPDVFRPERFTGPNKNFLKEYLIPFSIGGRNCIGEKLARLEIFVLFAYLMQNFEFKLPADSLTPSHEPIIGVTLRPNPFPVVIENRN